jgi:hypothetical protein
LGANNASSGTLSDSYSTGAVSDTQKSTLGGVVGADNNTGEFSDAYWDIDTSGISNPAQGAGNVPNDSGITGLTTSQFTAGLPSGFSSFIWGESPSINNGYPYLLALP